MTRDVVYEVVAEVAFGACEDRAGVGLEVELLPVATRGGAPAGRPHLDEVLSVVDAVASSGRGIGPRRVRDATTYFPISGGGSVTFEPGAQVEVSGRCHRGAASALREIDDIAATLAGAFDRAGAVLVGAGVDVWHGVGRVAQQLRAPRYTAMDTYLGRRGPHGAVMMRDTCSIQVNLDPGTGTVRRERWEVANLVAPLLVASFANSPGRDPDAPVSRRHASWLALDPTRTGFPRTLVDGTESDPVAQVATAAMEADVLLVRRDGQAIPGTPGVSFADWIDHGHPSAGPPTVDDLRYHLTTLFHEVRPRRWLEIRSVDALPARLRPVPVVLLAGLLYDDRARDQVRHVLEPHRAHLPLLLRRAATTGVADAALCAAAVECWSFALEGARRLAPGHVDATMIAGAERFVDRYTMRGRAPGNDLRDLLRVDPAAALAWAAEPIPTMVRG